MITKLKKWFAPTPPTMASFLSGINSVSTTGQLINPRTILGHHAVFRAVDLLSTSVARIPFDVYKKTSDGREVDDRHPAQYLLKHKPNNLYHRFQLLKTWVVNALTHGDGFIFVSRDELGRPIELYLVDPSSVSVVIEDSQLYYVIAQDGRMNKIEANNMLHLRGLGTDGISGLPVTQILSDCFGLGLTLQRYQNVFFSNAGKPSVVIKLPPEINSLDKINEFRDAWNTIHSGVDNAFKPAMLRPGAELIPLANDSAIESLSELREYDIVTIANVFGVPSHRLGGRIVSVAYGSLEQENRSFLEDLDGWLCQIEMELLKLLRTSEIQTHYIEANRDARVQIDAKTKAELFGIYRKSGLMSDEEIRKKMNMPVGMEGTFWTETNLTPRDKALAPDAPAAEPTPEDDEHEAPTDDANETDDKTEQLSRTLSASIVQRIFRRLEKSGKIDIDLITDELGHMPGFTKFVTALPDADELSAVLPEQRKAMLANIDTNKINEDLWKS